MTRDVHVSDALFARVEAAFGARETVDLTVTIGAYNMVSRILNALGIE
jgi:alkylhydroperoxidase family enzyme